MHKMRLLIRLHNPSHDHPENAEWSKAAAADLYAALLSGDACATHGRRDKYQELLKK